MTRRGATALLALVVVAGCTGERGSLSTTSAPPTGGQAGNPVGDAATDAVLAALEHPMEQSFTATYSINRKLGSTNATAVVSRGPLATSVTVGDVRFVRSDADHTCLLTPGTCEDGINDARISDLGIASSFWRDAPARALRVTYGRRAAPATGATEVVAGQQATCASVPVGEGVERYCALPAGAVALWDTAYVRVELTAWEPTVRQESFAIPTEAPRAGS